MHLDALISTQLTSHFFRVHAGGSITTHLNCKGRKKEEPDKSHACRRTLSRLNLCHHCGMCS